MQNDVLPSMKHISRVFLLSALILLGTSGAAVAAGLSKVGFIDIQKAISSTKGWKKSFAEFKNSFKKEKLVITQKEKQIKKMLADLNKQSFVLDPKLKQKKEDEFRQQKVAFERYVEDKNAAFARKDKEMTEQLLKRMLEVVKQIGKDNKFTMILEKKVLLYHDEGHDLTELAVKRYDLKYK